MTETATRGSVSFTITGEFLTSHARGLMLSDDPGRAWRVLADSLVGCPDDTVRAVLAGETDIVGDSKVGISAEDASDCPALREYLKDLRYIYAGRVRLNGRWWRPRGVVTSGGPEDARHAGLMPTKLNRAAFAAWTRRRSEFYAYPGERVELAIVRDVEMGVGAHVVFEPCPCPPQWTQPAVTVQEAVDESQDAGRRLDDLGAHVGRPSNDARIMARDSGMGDDETDELLTFAYAAEDEERASLLIDIGAKVREVADDDVFEMILLDGRVVKVPRAPFTVWALYRIEGAVLPEWSPISPSGLKMQMDNPYHSDWLLGAGIDLDDGYKDNVNKPAWEHITRIQIEAVDGE